MAALNQLAEELNNDAKIPANQKQAYLRSQQLTNPVSYVNTEGFRLRFLRLEFFNARKAALRIVKFLDVASELFGEFALERPIRLSDFPSHEMQFIRKGQLQFLPFRDRSGRRVMTIFLTETYELLPPEVKAKIFLYLTWTAGIEEDTQRLGLVYLLWFDSTLDVSFDMERYKLAAKLRELVTVRTCSVHICAPPKPIFQWGLYVMTFQISRKNRAKVTVHLGSPTELKYKVQTFGIPADEIPNTREGNIKKSNPYFRLWLKVREEIEKGQVDVIECPLVNDVIFRQGKTSSGHPGNAILLSLIEIKHNELQSAQRNLTRVRRKPIVEEVVREVKELGGRFLEWKERGLWVEVKDEEEVFAKVEYKVGEYRKELRAARNSANRRRSNQSRSPQRRSSCILACNTTSSLPTISSSMHVATAVPEEINLSPLLSAVPGDQNIPSENLSPLSPELETKK
mmetsp:Transcript_1263/g.2683  ORF Transcript_1263/g.2683 Transcript_1263/m.2683 type:complete len:456 (-) Transcript_1263:242-1609(-)